MSWNNFSEEELKCKCGCNRLIQSADFVKMMDILQSIRTQLGFPFKINSAFRCVLHHEEARKNKPGWHNRAAIDISTRDLTSAQKRDLLFHLNKTYWGIGIYPTFIHVDMRPFEQRALWVGK